MRQSLLRKLAHFTRLSAANKDMLSRIGARQVADLFERAVSEAALRKSEERQAFLLKLSDTLRPLDDPIAIQEEAARLLGSHLAVSRALYAEFRIEGGREYIVIERDYHTAEVASSAGRHPAEEFGSDIANLRSGRTIVVSDAETEIEGEARARWRVLGARACIGVPLIKNGRLLAGFGAHDASPRCWTSEEVALVAEVAERTWAAVERARAEAALRESEEQYRVLFESIDEGFCTIEVLFDLAARPIDYRFLQVNPVFERQTGLVGAVGRSMRELAPDHEEFWFETYGRIALTGEPARFEHQASALGRWYDVYAFRIGDPQERRVAVLFRDILERKRAEEALRESEERLRQFGEASSDVLWIRDAETLQWEYLTEAFEKIYGMPRENALKGDNVESWSALILPEDRVEALASIDKVRHGERVSIEFRIRRPNDGQIRWLRNTDFPMRDGDGRVKRIGGVGHDITALKKAEEHQRLLLAELQHRVPNTLSVIRSIMRRTADQSKSLEENTAHLEGRINAFARVQSTVTRDPLAGVDLASMVAEELRAAGAREGENLKISGESVKLAAKYAQTLGLALHELSTNALKYGALSKSSGSISVEWKIDGDVLDFLWIESGMHNLGEPTHHGFGREILERDLNYELKATTRFAVRPAGLHFEAAIPLGRILASSRV